MTKLVFVFLAAASIGMQPVAAQPTTTPDALVERLIAVLPDADRLTSPVAPPPDAAEVSRLNALNPGHENEIMAALQAYQNCLGAVVAAALPRTLRQVIRNIEQPKIVLLIEFYQSTDYRTLEAIDARQTRGETLTDSERHEAARIIAAYPLSEFAQLMSNVQQTAMQDDAFIAGATRCSLAKRDAFDRGHLRFR